MISEYEIKCGDKIYSLKYNNKALRTLEVSLDMPIAKIGEVLQNEISIGLLTEIFRVGLLHWNPDITLDEAGEIIDEVGITTAADAVGKAFVLAFGTEEEKPKNARKEEVRGTGESTSSKPSK